MSVFSTGAKNTMLDALSPAHAVLHTGDPGADGTANRIGGDFSTAESCTFSAAASGERDLSDVIDWTELTSEQAVSWVSFWTDNAGNPDTFLGKAELSGDSAANADGEFRITTDTKLDINDPAP